MIKSCWNFTGGSYFPGEDSFREQFVLARGNHSKSLVGGNVRENKFILPVHVRVEDVLLLYCSTLKAETQVPSSEQNETSQNLSSGFPLIAPLTPFTPLSTLQPHPKERDHVF